MKVLQIHPADNVWIALQNLSPEEEITLNGITIKVRRQVNAKQKVVLTNLNPGDGIYMYGTLVGRATEPLQTGEVCTSKNISHAAESVIIQSVPYSWTSPEISTFSEKTFNGYDRQDGRVGVANYWLVFPLVFYENKNIALLSEYLPKKLGFVKKDDFSEKLDSWIQSCTPGNDLESTTALAASGCNLILFTTGLGTPTGNPVAPVIKIASNSALAKRVNDIIDFNAGLILDKNLSIEASAIQLMEMILNVAKGNFQTKATLNRQFDFIPWKRGISL